MAYLILVACLPGHAATASETIEISRDVQLRRVAENVWVHTTYAELPNYGRVPANGLVVVDANEAMLIDLPWTDELTAQLLDWIAGNWHVTARAVVPTHFHEDCMGGSAEAHRRGVTSYALDKTVALAKKKQLPVPQHAFAKELSLRCGQTRVELKHFGAGHTTDNIVAWLPRQQVLFGGCLIKAMNARSLGNTSDGDLSAYPETLQKVRAAYPQTKVVVPGHGASGSIDLIDHTLSLCPAQGR
jgi:metallo-beta-lactamase class B